MAIIIDPDLLSQGQSNTVSLTITAASGNTGVAIINATSSAIHSAGIGDYFEIRGAVSANNNALFKVTGVTTPDRSYTVDKVSGSVGSPNDETRDDITVYGANTDPATYKSVYYNTYDKKIWLIRTGVKSPLTDDGVTLQALYSFSKEEWKNDADLIKFDFPFTAITPEQFELGKNWRFEDTAIDSRLSRKLVRTGGWSEIDENGVTLQSYAGGITLGTFEDSTDRAYYQQGNDPTDPTAPTNFTFTDAVNEAILFYDYQPSALGTVTVTSANSTIERTTGSFITDGYKVGGRITVVDSDTPADEGTYDITVVTELTLTVTGATFVTDADNQTFAAAVNNNNQLNLFLRANTTVDVSKSYDAASLADIGVTSIQNQVYRFPLTNSLDIKIDAEPVDVIVDNPYKSIDVKYFDAPYLVEVDASGTLREFGIVVDAGSYTGVDGSGSGLVLTSAASNIPTGIFTGGSLFLRNTAANNYAANTTGYYVASHTGTTITITHPNSNLLDGLTNVSFTLQQSEASKSANSLPASIESIYTKVQYLLRQSVDIDGTSDIVVGSTADELLRFVGDSITAGSITSPPSNPNLGGTGVFIEGYSPADINDITTVDNAGAAYNFPTVVTLTIVFNDNLVSDANSSYWMFFEYSKRTTGTLNLTTISGRQATLTSTALFGQDGGDDFQVGDYVLIGGFTTNAVNNGIYRIISWTSSSSMDVVKVDGAPPIAETGGGSETIDQDPIDTPDAIIVQDTNNANIAGTISGSSIQKNFAYTTNAQGARNAGDGNAAVIIRAIGFSKAQFVEVSDTITGSDKTFSVVSGLERNYANA
jgi:hypothetical protein